MEHISETFPGQIGGTRAFAAPEAKAHLADAADAYRELRSTFEAFRDANDQRLGEIEQRASADVLLDEKLARIDTALDEQQRRLDRLMLNNRRPALGAAAADPRQAGHRSGFEAYIRRGDVSGLAALEGKALSAGSGVDGGFVAPAEVEREILQRLAAISPMRALATVRTISAGTYRAAFSATGPASGWVGETAARPETATQVLSELVVPAMELYAMPSATQTILDDAMVDVDRWVADEVETVFAEQESTAFISGNGTTQPRGVLSVPVVADASWTWGNIGVLNSGAAGAFAASNPSDVLIELIYALRTGYRQNGAFLMNRRVQSAIRRFKDAAGNYIWSPPAGIGQPATLMNFPVAEAEAMPNLAANSVSVLFGDFRRGYLIVDRAGVRILRDPYSAKPYVLFYTTKRVGGAVQDFAAIKGLRFAA
jgi:HK97 family phage major capsid protein